VNLTEHTEGREQTDEQIRAVDSGGGSVVCAAFTPYSWRSSSSWRQAFKAGHYLRIEYMDSRSLARFAILSIAYLPS
jgi:hypothetical protein